MGSIIEDFNDRSNTPDSQKKDADGPIFSTTDADSDSNANSNSLNGGKQHPHADLEHDHNNAENDGQHVARVGGLADAAAHATSAFAREHPEMAHHLKTGTRKLDWTVVPPLLLMWLANFVDRSNAGNARIAGLEMDLGLEGRDFNTALAVFYVSYILVELPSNIILKKVGGNIWLPTITAAWGMITACTAAAQNYGGFIAIRFFLGAAEGGLLGGITLYLSTLYPRFAIQQRIARFYAAAAIAGSFGGLLASGLTTLNTNGIKGWRWLYIVEGVITVGFAIFSILIMPRSVATTRYLSEDERRACLAALHTDAGVGSYTYRPELDTGAGSPLENQEKHLSNMDNNGAKAAEQGNALEQKQDQGVEEQFEWYEIRRGIFDIQTWLTGILYLCVCNSLYSITLFLPTILTGVFPGASHTRVQLLTVPPFVPAAVMVLIVAYASDKTKMRGPYILGFLPIAIVGYIILVASKNDDARYAAVFLVCLGIYPAIPCILTLIANNSASHYKRSASTAFQLMIANLAGFIATFIYDKKFEANGYVTPHAVVLASLCLGWICIALNVAWCYRENAARAAGKRDHNIRDYEELVRRGVTRAPIGDRHPGFRFSL